MESNLGKKRRKQSWITKERGDSMKTNTVVNARCDKCGAEQIVHSGVIGKYHKKCSDRKYGEARKKAGKWITKKQEVV
jgi:ABC-type phosphonate transport system ATPase subunit